MIDGLAASVSELEHSCAEKADISGRAAELLTEKRRHLQTSMDRLRERLRHFADRLADDGTAADNPYRIPDGMTVDDAKNILNDMHRRLHAEGKELKKQAAALSDLQKNSRMPMQNRPPARRRSTAPEKKPPRHKAACPPPKPPWQACRSSPHTRAVQQPNRRSPPYQTQNKKTAAVTRRPQRQRGRHTPRQSTRKRLSASLPKPCRRKSRRGTRGKPPTRPS